MPATNTASPVTYETLATAATRTGVSTRTLRRRIAEGKLIACRLGPRLIRLNSAEVDAFLSPVFDQRVR